MLGFRGTVPIILIAQDTSVAYVTPSSSWSWNDEAFAGFGSRILYNLSGSGFLNPVSCRHSAEKKNFLGEAV